MSLLHELQAAGLRVRTVKGWETRGGKWTKDQPIGIMQHHTSLPVPYPIRRLYGRLNKANMNSKPDGTIWLICAGSANYSSGLGNRSVFYKTLRGEAPTRNATTIGTMYGNRYYWNIENDHPGDGSPIPQVQLDAIITATRVVIDHYQLAIGSVIGHAEWTSRKIDPYWNHNRRCIETIRDRLDPLASEDNMFPLRHKDGWTTGPRPHKRADVAWLQASFGFDYGDQQGFYGDQTAADLASALGVADPVTEFGWQQAQLAAAKGIFVTAGVTPADAQTIAKAVVNDSQIVAG